MNDIYLFENTDMLDCNYGGAGVRQQTSQISDYHLAPLSPNLF